MRQPNYEHRHFIGGVMSEKNKQTEPDKSTRILKHNRKVDGEKHSHLHNDKSHIHLEHNKRDHNYSYMKHLDEYVDKAENET
jgi:hypothetical protein